LRVLREFHALPMTSGAKRLSPSAALPATILKTQPGESSLHRKSVAYASGSLERSSDDNEPEAFATDALCVRLGVGVVGIMGRHRVALLVDDAAESPRIASGRRGRFAAGLARRKRAGTNAAAK